MEIVIDTSAVLAAVLDEPEKDQLKEETKGASLVSPPSLHWEIGNALSNQFKKGKLTLGQALEAVRNYEAIPIKFSDVDLSSSLEIAYSEKIYAYDAYMLSCCLVHKAPFLTLDLPLRQTAKKLKIKVIEV
jgi:predicted nucleic acid-binding protein